MDRFAVSLVRRNGRRQASSARSVSSPAAQRGGNGIQTYDSRCSWVPFPSGDCVASGRG